LGRRWKVAAVILVAAGSGIVTAVSGSRPRDGSALVGPRRPVHLPPPGSGEAPPDGRTAAAQPGAGGAAGFSAGGAAVGAGAGAVAAGEPALPAGAWSLPSPSRYEGVAGVGYPQTTMGALGLGYSALATRFTADPDLAVSVARATVLAPTTAFLSAVAQGTEALRARFGMAPTGPTPTTIGLSLVGCRVTGASTSRVVAGYEGTLSVEGGGVQGTTADVSAAIALAWDGSDWKIDPTADLPAPPIEFPENLASATPQGWHACAEE
jgi:hypothetical protein